MTIKHKCRCGCEIEISSAEYYSADADSKSHEELLVEEFIERHKPCLLAFNPKPVTLMFYPAAHSP